jgi:hypothetical protein
LIEALSFVDEVLLVDVSDSYRTKLSGPRVRLLFEDINKLPKTIAISKIGRTCMIKYPLEYSGFPTQCEWYHSFDHLVSKCTMHRCLVEERLADKLRRKMQTPQGAGTTSRTNSSSSTEVLDSSSKEAYIKNGLATC